MIVVSWTGLAGEKLLADSVTVMGAIAASVERTSTAGSIKVTASGAAAAIAAASSFTGRFTLTCFAESSSVVMAAAECVTVGSGIAVATQVKTSDDSRETLARPLRRRRRRKVILA